MSLLSLIAMAVALAAVIALAFHLPDPWFFGLLALATLLGAADAAYRELTAWSWAFLAMGVGLAAFALASAFARKGTT